MSGEQIRTGQIIDALLAKCRALPGYADPNDCASTGSTSVLVCDGPEWQLQVDQDECTGDLVIGWGGRAGAEVPSASSDWASGPIAGNRHPRDETTTVQCLASVAYASAPKEARDGALAILTAVAGICRSDPSLGLDTSAVIGGNRTLAFVTAGSLTQSVSESGFGAALEFTVTYKTRV